MKAQNTFGIRKNMDTIKKYVPYKYENIINSVDVQWSMISKIIESQKFTITAETKNKELRITFDLETAKKINDRLTFLLSKENLEQ